MCASPASALRTPAAGTQAVNTSGVSGGALFGGDMPFVGLQSHVGKLAIVRDYDFIGQRFPDRKERNLMAAGTTLMISLDTRGGETYSQVASGKDDASILAFLKSVEAAAVTYHLGAIYLCFEHEVDGRAHHSGLGTPAQFIQAWDHIHQLAVSAHLNWQQGGRIHWVMILTHMAYIPVNQRPKYARGAGTAAGFFPGTSEVDVIAVDGYNVEGCTHSGKVGRDASGSQVTAPSALFGDALTFAASHSMPVFITEFGTVAYSSAAVQAGFIHQMQEYVMGNSRIAAALYWNGPHPAFICAYDVTSRPQSLSALASMDQALKGHV